MKLWMAFWYCVRSLRPVFSREATFAWFVISVAAMCIGTDGMGVTGIIRAMGLAPSCYHLLLNFFHSDSWCADSLTEAWTKWVVRTFGGLKVDGRRVLIIDGIKIPKEGRKMPAVKSLHQESESNSKREYIMGHSFQTIGLLAVSGALAWCVPLVSRIQEGLKFTNRDKRTLTCKVTQLVGSVLPQIGKAILVGDAWYGCQTIARWLLDHGHHIVTRIKDNAVGYMPPVQKSGKRGRPSKYGKKVRLKDLFKDLDGFEHARSPHPKEDGAMIYYYCVNLLWKPLGLLVRFVAVENSKGKRWVLMSTDTKLNPLTIILLYGYRSRIEASFKAAVHTIGTYLYRFWMKDMQRIKRCSGDQHLHRKPEWYRDAILRKLEAIHKYVAVGLVAQGILQYLSMFFCAEVWGSFRSWMRTKPSTGYPSEATVSSALRSALSDFLSSSDPGAPLRKILTRYIDYRIAPAYMRAV